MWDVPDYDPDYTSPPKPTRRDHYCTDPTWRSLKPDGPFRMLGWQTLSIYGSRQSYRDVCELVEGEENLNAGRFKLFQYDACQHEVELGSSRQDSFVVTEWQDAIDHRGKVFDWVAANVQHAWGFHCDMKAFTQMRVFFSFEDPQEAVMFKLTWA